MICKVYVALFKVNSTVKFKLKKKKKVLYIADLFATKIDILASQAFGF